MLAPEWYSKLVDFGNDYISEMELIGPHESMKVEHARFLIVVLYGAILALVEGNQDLASVSLACQLFEDFHRPAVEGACVFWQSNQSERDEYLDRQIERFGIDEVAEATELQLEKDNAFGWMLCLRRAFVNVVNDCPKTPAAGTIRREFLSTVFKTNTVRHSENGKQSLLNIDDLRTTYRALSPI